MTIANQQSARSRITILALLSAIFSATCFQVIPAQADNAPSDKPAASTDNQTDLLSSEVWREESYGVCLQPPLNSQLRRETAADSMLRITGIEGYTISLSIKKSNTALDIDKILETAIGQLALAQPSAAVIDQQKSKPSGRPGAVIYFHIPDKKNLPWVLGQGFMQIDPTTFVVLKLEVDEKIFASTRPIFDAVMASLGLEDPVKIDSNRKVMIERGANWLATIDASRLRSTLVPEQWLRIIQAENKDVGYMRIRQFASSEMGAQGIRVDVQARILMGDQAVDSISNFFLSDDRNQEIWSIRTTTRPLSPTKKMDGADAPPDTSSWSETGLRSSNQVTISRQGPSGVKETRWTVPSQGYLSQVELFLVGPLLVRQPQGDYGFYAYFPSAGKLSFRSERVVPSSDGTISVYSRSAPDQPEQQTRYNSVGFLIDRSAGQAQKFLPATKAEMASIWNVR